MCEYHCGNADATIAWLGTSEGQAYSAQMRALLASLGITDIVNRDYKEFPEDRQEREERDRDIDAFLARRIP